MAKIDYSHEAANFRYLLYPLGRISDQLLEAEVKKVANFPEILLFCRIAATSLSIWRLLPKGENPSGNQPADIASVGALARNIIEAFNAFFFLCLDNVTEDEMKFRRLTTSLHHLCEQKIVGELLNGPVDELAKQQRQIDQYKEQIQQSTFYRGLTARAKTGALSGKSFSYLRRQEIAKKLGIDEPFLESQYKVLSNYTHPFSFGLYLEFTDEIGADCEEARGKLALILYFLNAYIGMSLLGINAIYPAIRKFLDRDMKDCSLKLSRRISADGSSAFEGAAIL
jgi:hypothetical protein